MMQPAVMGNAAATDEQENKQLTRDCQNILTAEPLATQMDGSLEMNLNTCPTYLPWE